MTEAIQVFEGSGPIEPLKPGFWGYRVGIRTFDGKVHDEYDYVDFEAGMDHGRALATEHAFDLDTLEHCIDRIRTNVNRWESQHVLASVPNGWGGEFFETIDGNNDLHVMVAKYGSE